jgi:hypothetical protein
VLKSALIGGSLISAALFLAACGGGESEEEKIVNAIETSATTNDPSACTEFATEKFNEQTTGQKGEAAVKECEKNAEKEETSESADVSNVEIDGSTATADVALTGGSLGGQTLTVSVVKEGDQWKLDEITGFAKLNRAKLAEALGESLSEANEFPKGIVACIVEGVEESSEAELEGFFFSGSYQGFAELVEGCSKQAG